MIELQQQGIVVVIIMKYWPLISRNMFFVILKEKNNFEMLPLSVWNYIKGFRNVI